jgi:hypothetical protein
MRRLPPQRASPTFPRSSAILQPAELPCPGPRANTISYAQEPLLRLVAYCAKPGRSWSALPSRLAGVRHLQGSHPPTGAGSSVNPVG